MQTWPTWCTHSTHRSHTQTYTHNHTPWPLRAVTSSTFPEATAWLKVLCHFHHERVSCETTNFSLFNFCSLSADAFIFQSRAWIFQGWVTDPVKNEKREGVGRVGKEIQGGMGNHIWFCRSHKWLKLCRFQSDCFSLHHLHRFPSAIALSLHFCPPPCQYGILQVYDEPKKTWWWWWWLGPTLLCPSRYMWVAREDKQSLRSLGTFIPKLAYYQRTRISIFKLSSTSEGMQNWT